MINKLKFLDFDIQLFADGEISYQVTVDGKEAEKGLSNLDKKSSKLSKKFANAGALLTAGLTTPIITFGTYAVKSASDFESASNQIQASLGLTTQEAKEYEDVMRNIYNANFGESYEDVANSIATVQKNLDGLKPDQIEKITESALTLRDTFEVDISSSVRATKALMDNFGISADESMNLIAQGFQNGLNYSDEFIDNINEYSVQFGKLGLTAEDMFDIFQSGANSGAWNLDKIGDAVKEFSIRAIDGSETTIDGFTRLGMSADDMAQKFASGGDTAKQAFYEVIDAIGAMEDPVEQSIVGVDLFGTMWEDLGPEVVTQLGEIKGAYDQTNSSMDNLKNTKYDDLNSSLEELKRQFSDVAVTAGTELVPFLQDLADGLSKLVTWFSNLNPETKQTIANVTKLVAVVGPGILIFTKITNTVKNAIDAFKNFGNAISQVTNKDSAFRKGLSNGIGTITTYAKNIGTAALNFGKLAVQTALATVKMIAQKAAMLASTIATNAMAVAQGALNLVMSMNPITLIIIAIVALIAIIVLLWNKCEWFRDGIMAIINAVWSVIQSVASFIMNIFSTAIDFIWGLIQGWFNFWKNIFDNVLNVVMTVVNTIVSVFSNAWNTIKKVATTVWNGILSLFSKGGKIFSGIVDGIAGVFKTIVNALISGINKIISVPFNTINGILNFIRNIDILGVAPFKGLWKQNPLPVPQIPKLFVGTNYIAREGLAYLHQGEAVVPKKYNPAVGGYGNNYQPNITIIADMDVNKFGKAFVKDIKTFSGGAKNSYNYGGSK